ncbi:transposon Tf2-9 polyprotein [Trichonephila clavipes]|nr:transposon Tf2-9 polyprotein [Trichonephila clavipes]
MGARKGKIKSRIDQSLEHVNKRSVRGEDAPTFFGNFAQPVQRLNFTRTQREYSACVEVETSDLTPSKRCLFNNFKNYFSSYDITCEEVEGTVFICVEDIIRFVENLDGTVESTDSIAKLKTNIEESSTFESDADFVKTLIKKCIDESVSRNERQATLENQKLEPFKLQLSQLFESLNKETTNHIDIREAEDWFRPIDLAKECDIYISSRSGSRKEETIACGYTEDPFKNISRNYKPKDRDSYPQILIDKVNDQIDYWLQQGIIRGSCSDYCSPIVLRKKQDAKPLSDLLRDNAVFHLGPEQQLVFQTLRQKLSENPVLHIFKQDAKLELHTDASKFGYGKQMGHVDCLCRYPVMIITYDEKNTKLANSQRNDEYINSLKPLLENKQINDFVVKNDIIYKIENYNDVLVVPQQMHTETVKNIHSKGHLGINKTESMAYLYEIGDIVAIQRTQFGTDLKLRPKIFGLYEIVKVKPKDRYDVRKIGLHEGPNTTSTAGDHMKIFTSGLHGRKKKNQAPMRTVYGQARRCGIGCGVATQLNLSTKLQRQNSTQSSRAGAADPMFNTNFCFFLREQGERKRDRGCASRRFRHHIMEIYLLEI